jgi:methyl-accepting chemotaxis protein
MPELLSALQRVSAIMKEIANASRTQNDDTNKLNQTIDRIDGDTQQNAAFVQETSQVAASLRYQVDALLAAVASFRLMGKRTAQRCEFPKARSQVERLQRAA